MLSFSVTSCFFLFERQSVLIFQGQTVIPLGGQTVLCCWVTNCHPFLRDKLVSLFEGQTVLPFWGTKCSSFLRDKQFSLFEGQTLLPFWRTNSSSFLRDKHFFLFEGQSMLLEFARLCTTYNLFITYFHFSTWWLTCNTSISWQFYCFENNGRIICIRIYNCYIRITICSCNSIFIFSHISYGTKMLFTNMVPCFLFRATFGYSDFPGKGNLSFWVGEFSASIWLYIMLPSRQRHKAAGKSGGPTSGF